MKNSLLGSILQGLFVGAVFGLYGIVSRQLKKRTEARIQKKKEAGIPDEQIEKEETDRGSKVLVTWTAVILVVVIGIFAWGYFT